MPAGESKRPVVALLVVGTLLVLGVSLWVHWPWLQVEHARLEPAYRVLVWTADAATLLWVVWFGIRYGVLGRPLPDASSGDVEYRCLLSSLLGALALDAAITAITAYHEIAGENNAVHVRGAIVGGRPTVNERKAYLVCRFQDDNQTWHESQHQVALHDQPPAIWEAVKQGRFPIPVDISYDPQWPSRCWLGQFRNEDDNRLHWLSAAFLPGRALQVLRGRVLRRAWNLAPEKTEAGGLRHRLAGMCRGMWVIGMQAGRGKQPEGIIDSNGQLEMQLSCQRWRRKRGLFLSSL